MKTLLFLLLVLSQNLFASGPVEAISSHLEEATNEVVAKNGKLIEKLGDLDLKFSAEFLDLDLLDGLNISSKYKYEVEDSYQHAYYSRFDKWDLSVTVNPGDLIKDLNFSPISFELQKKQSIYFLRQFKSKSEALKALPYTPKKLPLTAQSALTGLNPGDFVSIPGQLSVAVSTNMDLDAFGQTSPIKTGVGAYWIVSGSFTIQIYKVDQTRVRVKLLSNSYNTKGANSSVKASFDIFGVSIVDKQIKKIFNLNRDLTALDFSKRFGNQFIVDYVFDLSDEKAQAAYNQILNSSYKFKDLKSIGQVDYIEEIEKKIITSYDLAETLYAQDILVNNNEAKRVTRLFKGFTKEKTDSSRLKVNVLFVKHENEVSHSNKKITYIDDLNEQLNFLYPTYSKFRETKLGRGGLTLKDQVYQNHFALMAYDSDNANTLRDPDLGFTLQRKDKLITKNEIALIEDFLNGQVPLKILEKIDFSQWRNYSKNKSSQVKLDVVLKSEALSFIPNYSESDLKLKLKNYVKANQGRNLINPKNTKWETIKDTTRLPLAVRLAQYDDISSTIHKALGLRGHDPHRLSKLIIELNKFNVFNEVGIGFLISLLPETRYEELIYVKLNMSLEDAKEIDVTFGELNNKPLYDQLDQIQSKIISNSYDLRL